jgi:hypothetical protein
MTLMPRAEGTLILENMDLFALLLLLAAFLGAPGLLFGIPAGRKVARSGGSSAIATLVGVGIGLACGAVPALLLIHDVQSSSDANAPIGLIALPLPFITNLLTGTVAALIAHRWARDNADLAS